MTFVSGAPIYLQVVDDIKRRILCGELKGGDKLPSNSDLAELYKINPNTAQRVSKSLEQYGICYVRRGIGTFISEDDDMIEKLRTETVGQICRDFIGRMSDLGYSPHETEAIICAKLKNE